MSKSNPGPQWDPEQRKRVVADAVNKMKFVQDAKSAANDPVNELMERLANLLVDVRVHVKPVLQAGGGFDEPALKELVSRFIFETLYKKFNKEEIHVLLTILISQETMNDIKANPFGNDNPDLLSGN